jgi:hypothetical protein
MVKQSSEVLTFKAWKENTKERVISWSQGDRSCYRYGHHYLYETVTWTNLYCYTSHTLRDDETTEGLLEPFGGTVENLYEPEGYGTPFFKTLEDAFNFCNFFLENRPLFGGDVVALDVEGQKTVPPEESEPEKPSPHLFDLWDQLNRTDCFVFMYDRGGRGRHLFSYGSVLHSHERLWRAVEALNWEWEDLKRVCNAWLEHTNAYQKAVALEILWHYDPQTAWLEQLLEDTRRQIAERLQPNVVAEEPREGK